MIGSRIIKLNEWKGTSLLEYEIYSQRKYGEAKLSKPKELKNIKPDFSVDFIPKRCKCNCYILDNDLWIQHRDYFSEIWLPPNSDAGNSTDYYTNKYFEHSVKSKFIYSDNWGSIVLRNEAWIVFRNFTLMFEKNHPMTVRQKMVEAISDFHGYDWTELDLCWERFFDRIIKLWLDKIESLKTKG